MILQQTEKVTIVNVIPISFVVTFFDDRGTALNCITVVWYEP